MEVVVSGGELSIEIADRLARYILARAGTPECSVRIHGMALRRPTGSPVAPHLVRAGQWVEHNGRPYVIDRTRYDAMGRLTVELNEPWIDEPELMRRLTEAVVELRQRRSPFSGAPY